MSKCFLFIAENNITVHYTVSDLLMGHVCDLNCAKLNPLDDDDVGPHLSLAEVLRGPGELGDQQMGFTQVLGIVSCDTFLIELLHCCGTKAGLKKNPLLLYIKNFPLSS